MILKYNCLPSAVRLVERFEEHHIAIQSVYCRDGIVWCDSTHCLICLIFSVFCIDYLFTAWWASRIIITCDKDIRIHFVWYFYIWPIIVSTSVSNSTPALLISDSRNPTFLKQFAIVALVTLSHDNQQLQTFQQIEIKWSTSLKCNEPLFY